MSFRVIAIPTKVADLVRSTMRSPGYGHPAHLEVAAGYGPCRHCLRTFDVGAENRILFTYDPFHGLEPLPLPGPVFIHADACARFDERAGVPETLRHHRLTVAAYGAGRRLCSEQYVTDGNLESVIDNLFANGDIRYIHVQTPMPAATTFAWRNLDGAPQATRSPFEGRFRKHRFRSPAFSETLRPAPISSAHV